MTLPHHLSQTSAQGFALNETVAQFEIGDQQNFVYLIMDWETKSAAVVDPQKDLRPLLAPLREHGFSMSHILLTHTHFDHVAGLAELADLFPPAKVYLHQNDAHRLTSKQVSENRFVFLNDGALLNVGKLEVRALHTPGHSAGALSYFFKQASVKNTSWSYLLTGDTLFIRDCGRTDLPTGNTTSMYQSIQKIKALPEAAVILPGHHYAQECASTLTKELLESPPLRCASVSELEALP